MKDHESPTEVRADNRCSTNWQLHLCKQQKLTRILLRIRLSTVKILGMAIVQVKKTFGRLRHTKCTSKEYHWQLTYQSTINPGKNQPIQTHKHEKQEQILDSTNEFHYPLVSKQENRDASLLTAIGNKVRYPHHTTPRQNRIILPSLSPNERK